VRGSINVNKSIFRWSGVLASWLNGQKTNNFISTGEEVYIFIRGRCIIPDTDNYPSYEFVEEKINSDNRDAQRTHRIDILWTNKSSLKANTVEDSERHAENSTV